MVRREREPADAPLPELLPWSETRLLIVAFNRYLDRLRGLISRRGALQRGCFPSAQGAVGGTENSGISGSRQRRTTAMVWSLQMPWQARSIKLIQQTETVAAVCGEAHRSRGKAFLAS